MWGFILVTAALCVMSIPGMADPPRVELLWPDGAPGAKGNTEADKPSLTLFLPPPERATGTAIVICPGGGYEELATDHEGQQVGQWLNSLGIAGFMLKYRHHGTGYTHPAPLLDVQRAMRMVRSRAAEWHIDPHRIGVLGFSAGGHLASTVGTHFDQGQPDAKDPIERASCRPDFMILVYPVISLTEPFMHKGSRDNLLGANPDKELAESLSNEKQVKPDTPPTFLVHTDEDRDVPPDNSIAFYQALRKANVPAELHIYAKGTHGFGLGVAGEPTASWPARCVDWMHRLGFLEKK